MKIQIKNNVLRIPKNILEELNIRNEVNLEVKNDKIIITSSNKMKTRDEVKSFLLDIQDYDDDVTKGMKQALEWVLYEDWESKDNED